MGLVAWRAANRLEQPSYEVVAKLGRGVEVRSYAPYVVAEATVKRPMMTGSGDGFRACAGYIFGRKNKQGRTFAMTAPVRVVPEAESVKVSFVMARNESLKTLPVPTDSAVRLRSVPAHVAAFIRFSGGRPTDAVVDAKRRILESKLAPTPFHAKRNAPSLVYGYHDPFITPSFLRRNEVGVFVDSS